MSKQEVINKLYGKLSGTRNFLSGMTFDHRLDKEIKEAVHYKITEIETLLDELENYVDD